VRATKEEGVNPTQGAAAADSFVSAFRVLAALLRFLS
jgi:hypothetical protein